MQVTLASTMLISRIQNQFFVEWMTNVPAQLSCMHVYMENNNFRKRAKHMWELMHSHFSINSNNLSHIVACGSNLKYSWARVVDCALLSGSWLSSLFAAETSAGTPSRVPFLLPCITCATCWGCKWLMASNSILGSCSQVVQVYAFSWTLVVMESLKRHRLYTHIVWDHNLCGIS